MSFAKKFIKDIIFKVINFLVFTRIGSFFLDQVHDSVVRSTQSITHKKIDFIFAVPNRLNRFRVDTFLTKEPETLEWIDTFSKDSVFWDIGANIGLYSCYAAKTRGSRVYAFEPSVFNLDVLAQNIFLNGLISKVVVIPLPLSDKFAINTLRMTNTERGGALSTFGKDYGWDGHKFQKVFEFQTIGLTGDDAIKRLAIPEPKYLKVDVDGIEHLILSGAKHLLSTIDSLLIEINDDFPEQVIQSKNILLESGLILKEKRRAEMFSDPQSFGAGKVWNQIWIRNKFN